MVRRETTGAQAARLIAEHQLPGLVVADDADRPIALIPGSQVLALALPRYLRDDPSLAHAYDEASADRLCETLRRTTLDALLTDKRGRPLKGRPPSVLPDDTLIEIASVMVAEHLPLILVVDRDGRYLGVIRMSRVLAAIAEAAGH